MVLDKLAFMPADTKTINGVFQGYKGIIQNLSWQRVNIVIKCGLEIKGYVLDPGAYAEDFLLPNRKCHSMTFIGNKPVDEGWTFSVGAELFEFRGKKVHWGIYYDPNGR